MPRSAGKIRALHTLSVVFLLSTLSAAPRLAEANRALAQSPQAFEPVAEQNHFVPRSGIHISPGEFSMAPTSMRLVGTHAAHCAPLVSRHVLGCGAVLGGAGVAHGVASAVGRSGAPYVTGHFFGLNGVTQNGPVPHAFVAKLSADGSTVLYNTYLGGTGQDN